MFFIHEDLVMKIFLLGNSVVKITDCPSMTLDVEHGHQAIKQIKIMGIFKTS